MILYLSEHLELRYTSKARYTDISPFHAKLFFIVQIVSSSQALRGRKKQKACGLSGWCSAGNLRGKDLFVSLPYGVSLTRAFAEWKRSVTLDVRLDTKSYTSKARYTDISPFHAKLFFIVQIVSSV
jgi:hypothetical protein